MNKGATFDHYDLYRAVVRVDDQVHTYPIRTTSGAEAAHRLAIRAAQRARPRALRISVLALEPDPPAASTVLRHRIRSLRHRLGESRTVFASRFGVSPRTVEFWEQGIQAPRTTAQARLEQLEAWIARREATP